jgi:hypothetical protein
VLGTAKIRLKSVRVQSIMRGNARKAEHGSASNSSVNKSAKSVFIFRPAIPFLELRIELYELLLRQIGMSLLRHEFPKL